MSPVNIDADVSGYHAVVSYLDDPDIMLTPAVDLNWQESKTQYYSKIFSAAEEWVYFIIPVFFTVVPSSISGVHSSGLPNHRQPACWSDTQKDEWPFLLAGNSRINEVRAERFPMTVFKVCSHQYWRSHLILFYVKLVSKSLGESIKTN